MDESGYFVLRTSTGWSIDEPADLTHLLEYINRTL